VLFLHEGYEQLRRERAISRRSASLVDAVCLALDVVPELLVVSESMSTDGYGHAQDVLRLKQQLTWAVNYIGVDLLSY